MLFSRLILHMYKYNGYFSNTIVLYVEYIASLTAENQIA